MIAASHFPRVNNNTNLFCKNNSGFLVFLLLCKDMTMLYDDRMLPKYNVTATLQVCVLLLKFDWIGAMAILVLLLLMGWLHPAMYYLSVQVIEGLLWARPKQWRELAGMFLLLEMVSIVNFVGLVRWKLMWSRNEEAWVIYVSPWVSMDFFCLGRKSKFWYEKGGGDANM